MKDKTLEFIKKSKLVHGQEYDYNKVVYVNNHSKVIITCKVHGDFLKTPSHHLRGQGCQNCVKRKRITQEIFLQKAKDIHGNFYDYSMTEFKGVYFKIKISCPIHGIFEQRADHHLAGHKCKKCSFKSNKHLENKKKEYESFIKRATEKWKNKYDYSKVNYENARKKILIICPDHGEFYQTPDSHLKHNCIKCSTQITADNQRYNTDIFIKKSYLIHGDTYDYSHVVYKDNRDKVEIICKKHGSFWQTPFNHIQGKGCSMCKNNSKGESKIKDLLQENKISFKRQKTFSGCINPKTKNKLKFDFYLTDYNACIEYDGRQHFEIIDFWGGEKALKENKIRDEIKNDFCKKNNIKLLRINYKENILEKIKNIFPNFFSN